MSTESSSHDPMLYRKTIRGGVWVFLGQVFQQVLTVLLRQRPILEITLESVADDGGQFAVNIIVIEIVAVNSEYSVIPAGKLAEFEFREHLVAHQPVFADFLIVVLEIGVMSSHPE